MNVKRIAAIALSMRDFPSLAAKVDEAARWLEHAAGLGADITALELVEAGEHHTAAAKAVALAAAGRVGALMKGHLHTDELLHAVLAREGGLRTDRRLSHVFVLDVPGRDQPLFITDAAININPDLAAKADIVRNAIGLAQACGIAQPRVGILSAIETVNPAIPSSIDAAVLSKMAERGQITGGLVESAQQNAKTDVHHKLALSDTLETYEYAFFNRSARPMDLAFRVHADGDWTVETLVDADTITRQYEQGGLMVYVDDDNYADFENQAAPYLVSMPLAIAHQLRDGTPERGRDPTREITLPDMSKELAVDCGDLGPDPDGPGGRQGDPRATARS